MIGKVVQQDLALEIKLNTDKPRILPFSGRVRLPAVGAQQDVRLPSGSLG